MPNLVWDFTAQRLLFFFGVYTVFPYFFHTYFCNFVVVVKDFTLHKLPSFGVFAILMVG